MMGHTMGNKGRLAESTHPQDPRGTEMLEACATREYIESVGEGGGGILQSS